jgi:hypothetical protein
MPLEDWVRHSRHDMFLYDWQTLIAGVLAVGAAAVTIWATIWSANREVAAAQKQIEATLRLERRRIAREGYAFCAMLAAAMGRVLTEAAEANDIFARSSSGAQAVSEEAYDARTNFTKMGFDELRGACVRSGGLLTADFLELESEIDNFAAPRQMMFIRAGAEHPHGKHKGLHDQLAAIVVKAKHLSEEATAGMKGASDVLAETETEAAPADN